jgi:hypothetical protein
MSQIQLLRENMVKALSGIKDGKLTFRATKYNIAKRKAIFNQRKYGRLTALITC